MKCKLCYVAVVLIGLFAGIDTQTFQCPQSQQVTFEKTLGVRPSNRSLSTLPRFFVYHPGDSPSTDWITIECIKKCKSLLGCHSVLVLHQKAECIGFSRDDLGQLTVDNDASLFVKICMRVPPWCQRKLWTVESSPGYHLIAQDDSLTRSVENVTGADCSRLLTESGPPIRSAQFLLAQTGTGHIFDGNDIENIPGALGKCTLSRENKFTQPEAYRVANTEVFYKESQCIEDYAHHIDRCSYEEYYNQTLKHYDAILHGISTPECKSRCETEVQFNCRGFTTVPYESRPYYSVGPVQDSKICMLHSEDILTAGSWLLTKRLDAIYYRRVLCLNVTVECTPNSMTVTYWPRSEFRGRLYVSGYSDTCSTSGQGLGKETRLVVPFEGCGVHKAFSYTDERGNRENRTLMYTMLVIQNNPIIQAQGDRFVRAGCVAVPALNVTLGTNISVGNESEDHLQTGNDPNPLSQPASSIINTTGAASMPRVRMYIINEPDVQEQMAQINGGAVALGETIELRIDADATARGMIDIHAYHLVASSQLGDSSVLLLDGRGCPTGQVDFPIFHRTTTNGVVRLSSRFKAFRFPNSHVVKFSVMVQFCVGPCGQPNCDLIKGRRTRSIPTSTNQTEEFLDMNEYEKAFFENATVTFLDRSFMTEKSMKHAHVVVASTSNGARVRDVCKEITESRDSKVPLELSLIVASNDIFGADRLIYGENNRIVVASSNGESRVNPSMICIHEALFITITFVWLIIQILILAGCMIVVKRYRSFAEDSRFHKDYHSFDNLGFDSVISGRRVHWPDQSVDILHAS